LRSAFVPSARHNWLTKGSPADLYAKKCDNSDLKNCAEKTLPTLRDHLNMAKGFGA